LQEQKDQKQKECDAKQKDIDAKQQEMQALAASASALSSSSQTAAALAAREASLDTKLKEAEGNAARFVRPASAPSAAALFLHRLCVPAFALSRSGHFLDICLFVSFVLFVFSCCF